MGTSDKSHKSKKSKKPTTITLDKPATESSATPDPATPVSDTQSTATSPGEISPPPSPPCLPAEEHLENAERVIVEKLCESGNFKEEKGSEPDHAPHTQNTAADTLSTVIHDAAHSEICNRASSPTRVRYVGGRPDKELNESPPDRGRHFSTNPPLSSKASSPVQGQYTSRRRQVGASDQEEAEKMEGHQGAAEAAKNLDETGLEDAAKEGGNVREEAKNLDTNELEDALEEESIHPNSSNGPSYADIVANSKHSSIDLGGSYENIDINPSPPVPQTPNNTENIGTPAVETKALLQTTLTGNDIGTNIGDAFHQELAHMEAEQNNTEGNVVSPEARELQQTSVSGSDIGGNIGDFRHQEVAHEEAAHSNPNGSGTSLETKELQKTSLTGKDIGVNIGDTHHQELAHEDAPHHTPKPKTSSETKEFQQTTLTGKDIGTNIGDSHHQELAHEAASHKPHKTKERQQSSPRTLQMEFATEPTQFTSGPSARTHRAQLAAQTKRPNADPDTDSGHKKKAPRHDEGPTEIPASPTLTELLSLLSNRDHAISDLQSTIQTLTARLEALEKPTQVTSVEVGEREEGELETLIRWGLWTSVLVGVATVAGWVGAQVERGAVGRGVAEWIWGQV